MRAGRETEGADRWGSWVSERGREGEHVAPTGGTGLAEGDGTTGARGGREERRRQAGPTAQRDRAEARAGEMSRLDQKGRGRGRLGLFWLFLLF
jgi:hypothetical protein